ncbi:MAG: response regulator [Acidobacteriota bacterium]|nr:response regulator [Acidobacteriota bacterium]
MGAKILLYVEDEDAAFLLFQTALKTANIEVQLHRASDGEQALAFLRATGSFGQRPRPDLVVLDLNLPRKDGLDCLSEIREDDELRALPVVVFTSSSLSADKRRSLALGAQDYITKPFTYDSFVEAVKAACSYLPTH